MLGTDTTILLLSLAFVLMLFAAALAAVAAWRANRSAQWAQQCSEWIKVNNKRSRVLREIGELQAELTDLRDLYSMLNSTMKKLRSRIGMRELRARQADDAVPDPATDPAGYKRAMRTKLGLTGVKPNGG